MKRSVENEDDTPEVILDCTVLLATFNGENYIEEQLRSIAEQTLLPDAVFIFDDGSTDRTPEIIEEYIKRNYLRNWYFHVNRRNLGPSENILYHLPQANARLVFLADQDDRWNSNKIEVMTSFLNEHPQIGLLSSNTALIDKSGGRLDTNLARHVRRPSSNLRRSGKVRPIASRNFLGTSRIPLHSMCVRGELLEEMLDNSDTFPPLSRSLGADWYIGIWATLLSDAAILPDVLMEHRVHESNISLGRLRKESLLATTRDRRLSILEEARNAHAAILDAPSLQKNMTKSQRAALGRMIQFHDDRSNFIRNPSVRNALRVPANARSYSVAADGIRPGLHMMLSDFAYAYGINFKTKPKMESNE